MQGTTRVHYCAWVLCSMLMCASISFGQQQLKCVTSERKGKTSEYRVGRTSRTVDGSPTFILYISIKSDRFNRENMAALARRLNKEYCNEIRVAAYIFDYHPATKSFSYIKDDNPTYVQDKEALRGFYFLDRNTGEEFIGFSSARGKPFDEVKVKLSSASGINR